MNLTRLEELRDELEISKKKIANDLGISDSVYGRWENDRFLIPTRRLYQLGNYFQVNIDYILGLVKKYHDSNMQDKEVLVTINKTIMASPDLRNKKDLILAFINSLNANSDVYSDFERFMNSKKKEELDKIIKEENLNKDKTYNFVRKSFEQGKVDTNGTEISDILPPMSMFSKDNNRQKKKNKVIDKILEFFDKFFSLSDDKF